MYPPCRQRVRDVARMARSWCCDMFTNKLFTTFLIGSYSTSPCERPFLFLSSQCKKQIFHHKMERVCIIEMCLHRAFVERYKRHVGISCLYCFTCPMVDIYIYKNQAEKQIGGMKANPPAHLPLIHHNHWGHGSWRNHAILFMHTLCFFGRDPIKIFGNPTIQVIKSDSHHSIYERET